MWWCRQSHRVHPAACCSWRERENMADFIAKKREIFLVQMSLDTKRAEIKKLEDRARQREEALQKSEQVRCVGGRAGCGF
jgi:hypothetical protein